MIFDNSFFGNHFIQFVIINPQYRNKGVAMCLISVFEKIAGTGKIFTSTNRSNQEMINLLYKLNYIDSIILLDVNNTWRYYIDND